MARIAVGGWHHETNTFAPTKADYEAFAQPGAWPGLTRGPGLLEALKGLNVPLAGFMEVAREDGHEFAPLLWCYATPSAYVTEDAYERIAGMMCADLEVAMPVDAVYLDLHGAMVSEHFEDGEGELLGRVRAITGPAVPVVTSLDLHTNITEAMVARSDALVAYRTYPHVDMAETGRRAANHLRRLLQPDRHRFKAFRRLPYMVPITWQCTLMEPGKSLYASLDALEGDVVGSVSLAMGFPLADIREAGPSVVAYGRMPDATEAAAEAIAGAFLAHEGDFAGTYWEPDDAVRHAMSNAPRAQRPYILADTQDNPGGGADSDTTGILESLVRLRAQDAVVAMLCDPASAAIAHKAGEGSEITIDLGEKSGLPGHAPYRATFRVERLSDGNFPATGPFYVGSRMQLGPMALLGIGGVRVVVSSRKQQCADQAMIRHLGVDPTAQKILALKSSVHFRADFAPIAEEILVVLAPGPCIEDTLQLPYQRLREGLRLRPNGPVHGRP